MQRSRIFIGIDIAEATRQRASDLQSRLARCGAAVKWVSPENLHVTLLFLGDTDNRDLPAICRVVQDVATGHPPFSLQVSGVGAFPSIRRPKVIWAGITDGGEALSQINSVLERKLLELGHYRKEERGYHPHLTLGRVNGERDGLMLAPELLKLQGWEGGGGTIGELLVYSSELRRGGSVYTVLARGELSRRSRT